MTHSDIGEVLSSLQNSIRLQAALMAKLEANKAMDKDAEAELTTAVTAFKKTFA